jgi:hypothetical protein
MWNLRIHLRRSSCTWQRWWPRLTKKLPRKKPTPKVRLNCISRTCLVSFVVPVLACRIADWPVVYCTYELQLLLLCLVAEAIDVAGQSGELAPEDVLQIALRMASEIPEETVVDFEEALDTLAAGGKQQMAEKFLMINES